MKEILEPVLRELPRYLPGMFQLVVRPKRTMVLWIDDSQGDLTRPLVFVCVTVGIGILLQVQSLASKQDVTTLIAALAAFKIVAIALFGAIIHGVFVLLGGRASFQHTLSTYIYLISPLYLALMLLHIVALGIVNTHDPALGAEFRLDPNSLWLHPERDRAFAAAAPGPYLAYLLTNLAVLLVFAGWVTACWGAFRRVHEIPRWRSSLAGLVTLGLGMAFSFGLSFVAAGVFGRSIPLIQ